MSGPRGSNVVFVGNIPYELTEEQLTEVFKEVGPVVSFRLVFDRDSGRPRGYGFCEYHDAETAASAVRNLNNVEVGGRQLRVDYADGDPANAPSIPPSERSNVERPPPPSQQPPQSIVPQNTPQQSAIESISQTVQHSMTQAQLLEILSTMKLLIQTHQDQARLLLAQNPQLSYALFQALLQQNLVDPAILPRVLLHSNPQAQSQPNPVQNPPSLVPPPNYVPPNVPNAAAVPPQLQPAMYSTIPQQPQPMIQQPIAQTMQQPMTQTMQQPITQTMQQPITQTMQPPMGMPVMNAGMMPVIGNVGVTPSTSSVAGMVGNLSLNDVQIQEAQKSQLLLQVLNLPQQQIDMLPPEQRNHVLALKQQLLLQTRQT
ncbi:cleavage stimulation factor subunit [Gigaspora margarita]|nr:cleavage stimulation factor subunit [Gigaspora margarita]